MEEILVATPLPYSSTTQARSFSGGVSIRPLAPILWESSVFKAYIAEHDRAELETTAYWLCASGQFDSYQDDFNELYETARRAMYAHQIIYPSGCKNIYLAFHKASTGYDHIGNCRPTNMKNTLFGRVTSPERCGLGDDFEAVFLGIQKAFEEKVVRLQNPALLLEQGMQTGNRYLGTLLCVMGLDMLFMAGSKMPFISRLGGFLGLDSYVFPPVLSLDIQPREVVADVIEDVYELRNLIAHGLEIPEKPYRQYCDLRSTTGERINYVNYHYGDLILDSSLFLLTRALRKIFIENLYEDVKDVARWRAKMTLYEHRYKNAGGLSARAGR